MLPQAKSTGICQTCIHVSECAHCQNCQGQGTTIYHCENFDNQPVLHVVESENLLEAKHSSDLKKASMPYIQGRMKGLCVNCEKRVLCRYPVHDGGVWHCEEYC